MAAYDFYVDGVLRKSNNCVSKVVKCQKSFRLDVSTALVHIDAGDDTQILDTQMMAAPVSDLDLRKDEGSETVGTVELRLYVMRTAGTECALDGDAVTYLSEVKTEAEENDDKKDSVPKQQKPKQQKPKITTYKSIAPDLMLDFEKNCQEVDRKKANAEKKKLTAKRPDKMPWAIFRFYYRSKGKYCARLYSRYYHNLIIIAEVILKNKLDVTYNPKAKGAKKGEEPYVLELEPVSELPSGATPAKVEDECSTRANSPTHSEGTPPASETPLLQRPHIPLAYRRPYVEDASPGGTVIGDLTNMPYVEPKLEPKLERATAQRIPGPKAAKSSLANPKAAETGPTKLIESTPAIALPSPAPTKPPAPPAPTTAPTTTLKRPPPPTSDANANASAKRPRPPPATTATPTIAETRRELAFIKARRTQAAKRRVDLDAKLERYRAQVHAEHERLQRELDEEKKALREEAAGLKEDEAMLAKFEKGEGEQEGEQEG